MPTLTAQQLLQWVNAYTIQDGPPKRIVVPHADELSALDEVTVEGVLMPRQLVKMAAGTHQRQPFDGGPYPIESDGDLHFCLGTGNKDDFHVACELQNAAKWQQLFISSIGTRVSVSGYFRCLFEHPGFDPKQDAHIFEIHPVREVHPLGGRAQQFDVDIPQPQGINGWKPVQDAHVSVTYAPGAKTWTFSGMDGMDKNYIELAGTATSIRIPAGNAPGTFTFTSPDIGPDAHDAICLGGTTAYNELAKLKGKTSAKIWLVCLRNIDLEQAKKGRYVIRLLAIDVRPFSQGPAIPVSNLGRKAGHP